jgi:hypothetical protein
MRVFRLAGEILKMENGVRQAGKVEAMGRESK